MTRLAAPQGKHPLSRRTFMVASVGAVALFGFARAVDAAFDPSSPDQKPLAGLPPLFEPTLWYAIDADGIITVNIIRAEMGQHVGTPIARILADELEADWSKIRIVHVDSDPKWGMMVTGGSWSVWQSFPVYSRAGAAGRMALIEGGAKLLGVSPASCVARNGAILAGGRSIAYGEIVRRGGLVKTYTPDELGQLPLKPVAERRLIGQPAMALDIAAKINGAGLFGIDAKEPGMVYARPKMPPTRNGSKVLSVDDSAARKVKGYLRTLTLEDPSDTVPGWVLVIAESYYAAVRATELVDVKWTAGPGAKVSEQDLQNHALKLIADPATGAVLDTGGGNTGAAFKAAASTIEQTYTTSSVLHLQMEPLNALAFVKNGKMEIHSGNQWQSLILPTLAKALGQPEDSIVIRSYLLGGGFGRRLSGDYMVPAALAAKALGKPVKMVLTRSDDARFDAVRSPSVQTLRMAFDKGQKVTAMEHHAAAGWPTQIWAGPLGMSKGVNNVLFDPFAISGADHWYDVGVQLVRAIPNDLANTSFRPGWLRSVGPGWTNWALESFMDEAAHHVGQDPVAFRLKLLTGAGRNSGVAPDSVGGALRQANVVRLAAERAGWGQKLPPDSGFGFATSFGQERLMPTWTACVARVRVDRKSGLVKVEKLTIVTDAGTIVSPDGALAQVEGAALWGLSMVLHEGTSFENGQVKDRNLDTYQPLRIGDVPELDVSFVESPEVPVGLGEPATTVVGPAVGNAIYAAVGARLRHIPITPAAVLAALKVKS